MTIRSRAILPLVIPSLLILCACGEIRFANSISQKTKVDTISKGLEDASRTLASLGYVNQTDGTDLSVSPLSLVDKFTSGNIKKSLQAQASWSCATVNGDTTDRDRDGLPYYAVYNYNWCGYQSVNGWAWLNGTVIIQDRNDYDKNAGMLYTEQNLSVRIDANASNVVTNGRLDIANNGSGYNVNYYQNLTGTTQSANTGTGTITYDGKQVNGTTFQELALGKEKTKLKLKGTFSYNEKGIKSSGNYMADLVLDSGCSTGILSGTVSTDNSSVSKTYSNCEGK